jgi:hypothetical protein
VLDQLLQIGHQLAGSLFNLFEQTAPGRVRGVMLGVDDYWLEAAIRALIVDTPSPEQDAVLYWKHELLGVSVQLKYRPPQWTAHCQVMGYVGDAEPVYHRYTAPSSAQVCTREYHRCRSGRTAEQCATHRLVSSRYDAPCQAR